jgi:hypothetical protein
MTGQTIELKHKLNKHGEISRVDVAQTLAKPEDKTAANATSLKGGTSTQVALDTIKQ